MCALGLYLAFLVLEDLFIGNYSNNVTQNQITTPYIFFNNNKIEMKYISKRSISKSNHILLSQTSTTRKPSKVRLPRKVTNKLEASKVRIRKTMPSFVNEVRRAKQSSTKNPKTSLRQRIHSPFPFASPKSTQRKRTSSRIEFYYMDDNTKPAPTKKCLKGKCKFKKNTHGTTIVPFIIFHLKGPDVRPVPVSSIQRFNLSHFKNNRMPISGIRLQEVRDRSRIVSTVPISSAKEMVKAARKEKTTFPLVSSPRQRLLLDGNSLIKRAIPPPPTLINLNYQIVSSISYDTPTEATTVYDRIKFFEIHDKFTETLVSPKKTIQIEQTKSKVLDNNELILLENINQAEKYMPVKHEKKRITKSILKLNFINDAVIKSSAYKKAEMCDTTVKLNFTKQTNGTICSVNETTTSEPTNSKPAFSLAHEIAHWSDYPFTAVYIYEPSQVHCDAAAVNAHWLIASGSCLSRVSSKAKSSFELYEGQSAFVSYCGNHWWEPERLAYVKYTVVHPRYHPRDKTRQHLYNIGAIQVVYSMLSACAGWVPVVLMSHQFTAKANTTKATAVGWGLDRFDTRYGATNLPKTPLMAYKNVVYFDSCPGNVGYSKAKRLDEGGGVQNVHCLSLPPYYGEDADPVHGGLLLADGKLIGLYLQEERRPWGRQSAQYTGVWRLIPWIMDVAKEPEHIDTIIFEV